MSGGSNVVQCVTGAALIPIKMLELLLYFHRNAWENVIFTSSQEAPADSILFASCHQSVPLRHHFPFLEMKPHFHLVCILFFFLWLCKILKSTHALQPPRVQYNIRCSFCTTQQHTKPKLQQPSSLLCCSEWLLGPQCFRLFSLEKVDKLSLTATEINLLSRLQTFWSHFCHFYTEHYNFILEKKCIFITLKYIFQSEY